MRDFTVLVVDGALASGVAITLDALRAACAMAARLGLATPRWRVVSHVGGQVALSNGLSVQTESHAAALRTQRDVWIVPGLGVETPEALAPRLAQADAVWAAAQIDTHVRAGGVTAAGCSSVFLLQSAGVLSGKTVTTTWWLAQHLRHLQPDCQVDAHRMLLADGNLVTAGAALAQADLMLHLLRVHLGAAMADAVSRVLLIDQRAAQANYVIPSVLVSGNPLISQLCTRIEAALPHVPSMAELAADCCMSERTLARRVVAATGYGPMALMQCIRLSRARALLEGSRHSVEQVAALVGYADSTALRRMMKKSTGATPRQMRGAVAAAPLLASKGAKSKKPIRGQA
jgi:transcriptional regulator GlxA family with amidase domain